MVEFINGISRRIDILSTLYLFVKGINKPSFKSKDDSYIPESMIRAKICNGNWKKAFSIMLIFDFKVYFMYYLLKES